MKEVSVNLIFLIKDDQVLLAMKKRGFGMGRYNGVGGKVEPYESNEQAAIRETREEINVEISFPEKVAKITFDEYIKGNRELVQMHVFIATNWIGEPSESEEVKPQWFNKNNLPFDKMWPDDPYWLPQVLEGKKIVAKFEFNETNDTVLSHEVNIVEKF